MRIDQACPELDALLLEEGVNEASFITAWNPYGKTLAPGKNNKAHKELLAILRQDGWKAIEGVGEGLVGDWPAERSVLVIGIPLEAASEIGRRFGQNAIVHHEARRPSRLIPLVDMLFGGSQSEGPDLDLIAFSEINLAADQEERLRGYIDYSELIEKCASVEAFTVLTQEGPPGLSDTFYTYRVHDPDTFRVELRALIGGFL